MDDGQSKWCNYSTLADDSTLFDSWVDMIGMVYLCYCGVGVDVGSNGVDRACVPLLLNESSYIRAIAYHMMYHDL